MLDELDDHPAYAIELVIGMMDAAEVKSKQDDMKLHINARCMDLLEVIPIQSYDRHMNATITYEVDFLHRTVRDFFRVKKIQLWIEDRLPKGFNPSDALSRAFLAQLKTLLFEVPDLYEKGKVTDLVDNIMHYVHEVETQTGAASTPVVDELSRVIETYIANSRE